MTLRWRVETAVKMKQNTKQKRDWTTICSICFLSPKRNSFHIFIETQTRLLCHFCLIYILSVSLSTKQALMILSDKRYCRPIDFRHSCAPQFFLSFVSFYFLTVFLWAIFIYLFRTFSIFWSHSIFTILFVCLFYYLLFVFCLSLSRSIHIDVTYFISQNFDFSSLPSNC